MPKAGTILLVIGAAVAGLLAWAYVKSKESGNSQGVFGTIKGLWGGASDLTQSVTEKSVGAATTLGGGVSAAARGAGGLVSDAAAGATGIVASVAETTKNIVFPWRWF